MKVKDESYLHFQGWMRTRLGLKGNELVIYAVIYGFSQDGSSWFSGSAGYLADWAGITRQQAMVILKKLLEKQLIIKREKEVNGVKLCDYKADLEKITPCQKTLQGGCKETLHHTEDFDNNLSTDTEVSVVENPQKDIKDRIFPKAEAEKAINLWNSVPSLPNVMKLSDKRKSALKNLLKEYDWGQFEQVIENIRTSSFLNGTSGRWQCSFDWILNRNNFLKVLEGQYKDRGQTEQKNVGKVAHGREDYNEDFDMESYMERRRRQG